MKVLYLDCAMGAAGDMLAGALVELLPDPAGFTDELNGLGLPGVRVWREPSIKCGIQGTRFIVQVNGREESAGDLALGTDPGHHHHHEAHHDHNHGHGHQEVEGQHRHTRGNHAHEAVTHEHSSMQAIGEIIHSLPLSASVQADVIAVYRLIAEAESHIHGIPVPQIHFHEVGTLDAITDITAVCLLMDRLAPDEVVVSPIHVGSGQVACAHGILPVPAPATAHILRDVPMYGGNIHSELCTPTGAALLKHFATRFGHLPQIRTTAIGHGMGKKDFAAANCVRAFLGDSPQVGDLIAELSCNLDDMTAEAIGFAQERFFDHGALEVFTMPAHMKKSRPGTLLTVLCREEDRRRMVNLIFAHTTTLGIRENVTRRYTLDRSVETVHTEFGDVRKKTSVGYGVTRAKLEHEDIARIAREHDLSLTDVSARLSREGQASQPTGWLDEPGTTSASTTLAGQQEASDNHRTTP